MSSFRFIGAPDCRRQSGPEYVCATIVDAMEAEVGDGDGQVLDLEDSELWEEEDWVHGGLNACLRPCCNMIFEHACG